MSNFYTYIWLREDGTPYYVGKGKGQRAFISGAHNVQKPADQSHIQVQEFPDEASAFEAEKFLIAFYGRKNLGTGCLRNLTDGGEGPSGRVLSAETRQRIGITSSKPRNAATRARISAAANSRSVGHQQKNIEHCRAMAAANIGTSRLLGRSLSLETRASMSAAWTAERRVAQGRKMMKAVA